MESNPVIWVNDATQKLQYAQSIGAKANTLLLRTRNTVQEHDDKLSKGNFLLDAIDQQLQVLETIQRSISRNVEKKKRQVGELSDYLASCIDDLELEYQNLKDIEIDKALNSKSLTLYDLVTTDIVIQLRGRDKDVNDVCTNCIAEFKERDRIILTKIKSFTGEFNKLENKATSLNDNTWVDMMLEEIYKYEEEIASLIESVTTHYDQCTRGLAVSKGEVELPGDEEKELFDVLAKDFLELPEVINDIEETFSDIETRCMKIMDFNKDYSWFDTLAKLLKDLVSFGDVDLVSTLDFLEQESQTIMQISNDVKEKCQESKELISHYQKFTKAYYSLILELQRRHETKRQIEKIIRETKQRLEKIQDDDFRKRSQFLNNYGAFLPSDLYLGINDVESPLYSLEFEAADVPELKRSILALAERKASSRD